MKRLIIHGDPGIRKGAIIEYDGEEVICFAISRNGEWHGPEKVQLWCTVGTEDEFEDFEKRNFTPHFLDVDRVDAEAVEVIRPKADLAL
ncbi:HAH_0734 family protein [Natronococcus wangiae]|uniref:HAH_0734 family protein n=1 Tax=Natronococcus wangiae TaxID=3068275 RepID=UPI00273F6966|nr:HAH_0734 family protein [Natronococcus sp. AD5]